MLRHQGARAAFTLIEVMVAVMIVSVVIAALLQMQGSSANSLFEIKRMMQRAQYASFMIEQREKYGFENSSVDLLRFTEDFALESELRQRLKAIAVRVHYEEVERLDTSSMSEEMRDANLSESQNSGVVLEIGKTQLHSQHFTISLLRVRLQ